MDWTVADLEASEIICHDDVDAWHAPSECHRDVGRGCDRARAKLELEMEAITGMNYEQLVAAVQAEGVDFHKSLGKTVGRIYLRDNPFI